MSVRPKASHKRDPLYRFSVGSDFGVTKRDRKNVASALASLMSRWGVSADVQLKEKHTIAVNVYSPLTKEQLRRLGSQLERDRNKIETAPLKDGFKMTDDHGNFARRGPERKEARRYDPSRGR